MGKNIAIPTMTAAQVCVTELARKVGVVGCELCTANIFPSCGLFNDLLTRKVNSLRPG
jgi:hypothetical protein